ncbi:hypothetical protein [Nocardioides sp.]|uniref:hypothetical protein n=1 Tax=Nocardioides sp. TaxID=35761 RepID=UPI0025E5B94B|nr:hypothetical protein [Nocardioides sp.]
MRRILGRFPAGFERSVPGGYLAAEEFVVLDGELELEGELFGRGTLSVVPAGYPRTHMRSPQGALVLAWFGGLPEFLPHDALPPCAEQIRTVRVDGGEALPVSPVSVWRRGAVPPGEGEVEVVSADLSRWTRGAEPAPESGDLARRERR